MSRDGGGKPGKGGRQMTSEEAELWRQLSRTVDKVKVKPRVATHDAGAAPAAEPPRPAPPPPGKQPPGKPRTAKPQPAAPPAPPPDRKPPPAALDRRALRQVAGGKVPIDASLDLHGLRQDEAHARLRAFLVSSQAKGHRMVLVITGKGGGAGPREDAPAGASPRGVLRRSVPLWLDGPELRAIVLSYAQAGVRHGGEGALYVRLRKARGT